MATMNLKNRNYWSTLTENWKKDMASMLLLLEEGNVIKYKAYTDSEAKVTIGIGFNIEEESNKGFMGSRPRKDRKLR